MLARWACLLVVVLTWGPLLGQETDAERISRTTWHSAVLPGWGQVNNGKWWKVPLVYGALGVSGYFIQTEGAIYKEYRDGYLAMTDDDPLTVYVTEFDAQGVLERRDFHRSNLEQSVLTFVLLWGAQVVDAHVDAHLLGFDVSEDLSWSPQTGPVFGLKLSRSLSSSPALPAKR
ncbi:MAG: hypothetical protein CBC74_000145 [Crocinitomicaceae bacterium TMED114]|nr:MAG: hypothetical protein CBC74_000145 [Crocinitomicaceae bacterium TMED114]